LLATAELFDVTGQLIGQNYITLHYIEIFNVNF